MSSPPTAAPFSLPRVWHGGLIFGASVMLLASLIAAAVNHSAVADSFRAADRSFQGAGRQRGPTQQTIGNIRSKLAAVRLISTASWGISVFMGLAFIAWFQRMHSNLAHLQYKPRWSTIVWIVTLLIPVVNLISIVAMLHDLWLGSDPAPLEQPARKRTEPTVIYVWWLLGIAGIGCAIYLLFHPFDLSDIDSRYMSVLMVWLITGITVAQQFMYILMLTSIRKMQEARFPLAQQNTVLGTAPIVSAYRQYS